MCAAIDPGLQYEPSRLQIRNESVRRWNRWLPLVGLPFAEAVAVMAQYNPFFEKAGLRKIMERFPDHETLDAIATLRQLGFNPMLLGSTKYNLERLRTMNPKEIKACKEILTSVHSPRLKKFSNSHAAYGKQARYRLVVEKASLIKLAKMLKVLSFLAQIKVYLLWETKRRRDRVC